MSTPLANKTTISSRNKLAQLVGEHAFTTSKLRGSLQPLSQLQFQQQQHPVSQIARNPALKTPAIRTSTSLSSRTSNQSNGIPTSVRESKLHTAVRNLNNKTTAHSSTNGNHTGPPATTVKMPNNAASRLSQIAMRIPPATTRVDRRSTAISSTRTSSAIVNSRLTGPMSSRSPSVLSSVSSTNTLRQPTSRTNDGRIATNHIPDTNSIRKGLAKFSNPMECQRQFHALNQKLCEMKDTLKDRDLQVGQLQEQLKGSIDKGLCYALVVQYFSKMLKLDCPLNLPAECEQLKSRVAKLEVKESKYEEELDIIVSDYKNHIQVERDLRANIEKELEETRLTHSKELEDLSNAHRDELNDLKDENSAIQDELSDKIATLESDLDSKCKELSELRSNHEALTASYNKLEESLTKDKDARVKYAQEKVNQLQKDVDSLNSVLEMKSERMHALEKDSIMLAETQTELAKQKEFSKSLAQRLESLEAALDKRREEYEILIAEHEKIRQELKHERLDRRRTNVRRTSEIFSTP